MARAEIGSWNWMAGYLRNWGLGIFGASIAVASLSLVAPDVQDIRKTMLISGGGGAVIGGFIYLLGMIGQGRDQF